MTRLAHIPDGPMSERDYQAQIVTLARTLGYRVKHDMPGRTKSGKWVTPVTEEGWPDLVMWRPPRILMAEIKGGRTPLTDIQHATILELRACGLEVYVWRSGVNTLQSIGDILYGKTRDAVALRGIIL